MQLIPGFLSWFTSNILSISWATILFLLTWFANTGIFYRAGKIVSGVNTTFTDSLIVTLITLSIFNIAILGFGFISPMLVVQGILPLWMIDIAPILAASGITIIAFFPLAYIFFDLSFLGALVTGIVIIIQFILVNLGLGWLLTVLAIILWITNIL